MQIMSAMSSSVRFKSLRNDKQRQQLTDTAQPNSKRHLAKSRHSWKERDFVNLREPPQLLLGRIVLVQLHSVLGGGPRLFVSEPAMPAKPKQLIEVHGQGVLPPIRVLW